MDKIILLIDDDPGELEIFRDALNRIAVPTSCAQVRSAAEALEWLKKNYVDYIFIDFDLPGVNGIQCLEKIRKIKKLETTCYILYSSNLDAEMNKKAMALGATMCMKKPHLTGLLATKLKDIFLPSPFQGKNLNLK